MHAELRRYWLTGLVVLVAGCATPATPDQNLTQCSEPRPQICTMDYNPVCGLREDDTVGTYPNGCGACADTNVTAYAPGECQETGGRSW